MMENTLLSCIMGNVGSSVFRPKYLAFCSCNSYHLSYTCECPSNIMEVRTSEYLDDSNASD